MKVRSMILLVSICVLALANCCAVCQAAEPPRYSKSREFFIPFVADPKRPIAELRLFAQRNGGDWEHLATAQPTQKGFKFQARQDGVYGLTVQTIFKDGTAEPTSDKLHAEMKIVVDTIPPKISIRPFSHADGTAGVEWAIVDDNLDEKSIRLERRRADSREWEEIDKGVAFHDHDRRKWELKAGEKIDVRVRAVDLAKNETVSPAVKTWPGVKNIEPLTRRPPSHHFLISLGLGGCIIAGAAIGVEDPNEAIRYAKQRQFTIPLGTDPKISISKFRLYSQHDDGEWELVNLAQSEDKGFEFKAKGDGIYRFSLQTTLKDGTTAPARNRLKSELTVVVDTVAPTIKITPFVAGNGMVGATWEVADENLDMEHGIQLECRQAGEAKWSPCDSNFAFGQRDWRIWTVKPDEKLEIRIRARDFAGNVAISEAVKLSPPAKRSACSDAEEQE